VCVTPGIRYGARSALCMVQITILYIDFLALIYIDFLALIYKKRVIGKKFFIVKILYEPNVFKQA